MTTLVSELEVKQLIIDVLNLEDVQLSDIDSKQPLFVDGLGLDSIDALELGVAIKKKYNVTMNADDPSLHQHFQSVQALVSFINNHKK
ncbi:MAG: hypothetical protein ACD_29C00294G0002 [uncultured bacterium]|nr:MAG: hypothetical protein ACD_29C00294G0002 [uncultured bacterium]OGT25930.1 MAG: acyl carrier protein [Gammaproteobacteria bacterium RIFCSPHIGHO2_02_FULL_42_43]OGT27371.1 MAG: acyl carrier protein [Gammaproteobacteria bacterium RIFCSPHIGHO2_01_FULL_42_8]OGT52314.1 MAG: acyl carrier protein [Gammaproteobacteria bacterium RIFCSPHIGHO2_12_FULL_41_25]OGT61926.1 MAG: acyl carrier protein [Gammaproteobacteria bacterium RIFCSPLOWO2_02_FULL_42_14]OGT86363.1 MAG: acyl carrier protein [Gammaproteoba